MTDDSLAVQVDGLLRRFGLEVTGTLKGASEGEIAAIEKRAGRTLPQFYHWFLRTMGRDMGGLTTGFDMRVGTILRLYDGTLGEYDDEPDVGPDLPIGYLPEYSPGEPGVLRYDLALPLRDDAAIRIGGRLHSVSLAEWIAHLIWTRFGFRKYASVCKGWFRDRGSNGCPVPMTLAPLFDWLGLARIVISSDCHAQLESKHAVLALSVPLSSPNEPIFGWRFELGGANKSICEILDTVANRTQLEIAIDEDSSWRPSDTQVKTWGNETKRRPIVGCE